MARWDGFLLSLVTAVLWGVLPVFLHISLQALDSVTITWGRFLFAGLFVFGLLASRNALPSINRQLANSYLIVLVAALLLVANYVANVQSLAYVNPETVQVVMQIAPVALMFGGVIFFKETLNRTEMLGVGVLFIGLMLFFSPNISKLMSSLNDYSIGILLIVFAALTWAGYALLQKVLLRTFTAKQLTLIIYVIGVAILLPFIDLTTLNSITALQWGALVFCCVNTVVAYGCFTEALNVWSAAKVSAVIATGPIFTFLAVSIAQTVLPEMFSLMDLTFVVVIGAVMVVLGSITVALAKQKRTSEHTRRG